MLAFDVKGVITFFPGQSKGKNGQHVTMRGIVVTQKRFKNESRGTKKKDPNLVCQGNF